MADRPNIVFATLDSVRADHTSLSGYGRDTTPELQRIAEEGVAFEDCFAHATNTAASVASLMTGVPPSRHQVGMNEAVGTIPDELDTLPTLLGERGYTTACVTTNPRVSLVGADEAFDEFVEIDRSTLLEPQNAPTTVRYLANSLSHSAGPVFSLAKQSFAFLVNEFATRWLDTAEDPFFLYVHYNEPHTPYVPALSYRDRFVDDVSASTKEALDAAVRIHEQSVSFNAGVLDVSDEEWEAAEAMYDAQLAYTDACVGELFDETDSDAVFAVTADHGELLGEHGLFGHGVGAVTDEEIHVPLVVTGLSDLPDVDEGFVQHSDLVTTLLTAAGAPTEQTEGTDLRESSRSFVVAQDWVGDYSVYEERNPDFELGVRKVGRTDAIRTAEYKLVTAERGEDVSLYRTSNEGDDVAEDRPDVRDRLLADLESWDAAHGEPVVDTVEADDYEEATKRRLADLGYLQ